MSYRFGKHPPKTDYRTLRLADYMAPSLPPPPPAVNILTAAVYPKIGVSDPSSLFPMDGNDKYGDCTIAALAHAITVYEGMVGKKKIMTAAAVQKIYFHLSGGVDSGLNELDVLNYWRKTAPAGGEKILGYVKIDPKNHLHVMQAIALFGGVYIGFQCQESVISDFDAHRPWTPGKLTNDGHAVYAVGYDPQMVTVLTWGDTQQGTWGWWDECVDECYAILPAEAQKATFDPGLNFAQLQADLAAVAN